MPSKLFLPLLKTAFPSFHYIPTSLITLPASLGLHFISHPAPTISNYVVSPTTSPLHLPLIFTLVSILVFYLLGLVTGKVSWVDKAWPLYPPTISAMLFGWVSVNHAGGVYAHNLPRVTLMFGLQLIWSFRLFSHAVKRGFYSPKSEDYRYTVCRKLVPRWAFALIHAFVVASAQPTLLMSLSLPLYAALVSPPVTKQMDGWATLTFETISRLLPFRFRKAALPHTAVLNMSDYIMTAVSLLIIYIEYQADKRMYHFQQEKHDKISSLPKEQIIHPTALQSGETQPLVQKEGLPQPSPYPASHHPGFPTQGMWRFSRHPNFAAEQLFWVSQAMFAGLSGKDNGLNGKGWWAGCVFGPSFALSLLFLSSTTLTEWITERKYPLFKSYKGIVGEFLPQETLFKWAWTKIRGSREALHQAVYGPPSVENYNVQD
ncbi:hypothetical protein I312_102877 [Cryptococcus bacillisporus CA1280]|uniref:Steroid 5-alpha reductase C-terminal domain-containing protein n=1 Tax=Cryptococcus bacillisporus CA1280 TaxID=1296109 RepID=A0A0D0VVR2_CRYGA|nr:hypothetical protein I312_00490 [Cryptococcus bacillisporus CA1280]